MMCQCTTAARASAPSCPPASRPVTWPCSSRPAASSRAIQSWGRPPAPTPSATRYSLCRNCRQLQRQRRARLGLHSPAAQLRGQAAARGARAAHTPAAQAGSGAGTPAHCQETPYHRSVSSSTGCKPRLLRIRLGPACFQLQAGQQRWLSHPEATQARRGASCGSGRRRRRRPPGSRSGSRWRAQCRGRPARAHRARGCLAASCRDLRSHALLPAPVHGPGNAGDGVKLWMWVSRGSRLATICSGQGAGAMLWRQMKSGGRVRRRVRVVARRQALHRSCWPSCPAPDRARDSTAAPPAFCPCIQPELFFITPVVYALHPAWPVCGSHPLDNVA